MVTKRKPAKQAKADPRTESLYMVVFGDDVPEKEGSSAFNALECSFFTTLEEAKDYVEAVDDGEPAHIYKVRKYAVIETVTKMTLVEQ